jgi:uncharacterized protein (DUF302 family)
MKYLASALGGAVLGGLLVFLIVWNQMPSRMISIHKSPYDLASTVEHIEQQVKEAGWKMPQVYDLQKSLAADGYKVPGIRVFSICNPHHANRLLGKSPTRFVSAMMPCRIAVYEHQGKTHVATMNVELLSGMFGGEIETVMYDVAVEQEEMLRHVLAERID